MEERAEICISLQLEDFRISLDKSKKVASIKNDGYLKKIIFEKLGLADVSLKYEFHPNYQQNELIADWLNRENNPKVVIIVKSKSQSNPSQTIGIFGVDFGTLNEIEKYRQESILNEIKKIEIKHDRELRAMNEENKIKFKEINEKLDHLIGEKKLHPLLDFVSKFRLKIVEYLKTKKKIPLNINNWSSMHDLLRKNNPLRQVWSIIDEEAENLGLNYEDWLNLREISNNINSQKHPDPRINQRMAYEKIESLKSTQYEIYQAPFKNLIDLFEKNNWQ